jgi:nucleotide-binding universal stress UspA family protein
VHVAEVSPDKDREQVMFAKILVPLTGAQRDQPVLAGAFAAAKLFAAHVEALFIRPDPVEAMPFYGEGMSSAVVQEIMDVSRTAASKASRQARAFLEAAARESDATITESPERGTDVTTSFREVEGNFSDQVTLAARLADLVVFGPAKEDDRPGLSDAFDTTLIETGRPVLLISGPATANFASKISIAWNASVASAHAISAALPFLAKARTVEILTVKRGSAAPGTTDDLVAYLKLHGIAASTRVVEGSGRPIADVLLDAAKSGGSGLLVAGGYGHSRLRDLFMTGVTKRVVAHAAIPCFLVH